MKSDLLKLTPAQFCDETHACDDGRAFAIKCRTMAKTWDKCPRVDWLVWILNAIDAPSDERACRLYMVWCARNTPLADGRTTNDLLTHPSSQAALVAAERFARGEIDDSARSAAMSAARSAAESAARSAAWNAAESAAWSAARSAAEGAAEGAAWSAARSAAADRITSKILDAIESALSAEGVR